MCWTTCVCASSGSCAMSAVTEGHGTVISSLKRETGLTRKRFPFYSSGYHRDFSRPSHFEDDHEIEFLLASRDLLVAADHGRRCPDQATRARATRLARRCNTRHDPVSPIDGTPGIGSRASRLSPGDRPYDQEHLLSLDHRQGQEHVGRAVRKVLPAGEEPDEGPTMSAGLVPDRAAQHREICFECVEQCPLSWCSAQVNQHFPIHARESTKTRRKLDTDRCCHGSVCASTDSTGGRSCTMENQVSPESVDA